MRAVFQTAVRLLFPSRCVGCGALVESDFALCAQCWRETPFIGGTVCDACGAPLPGAEEAVRVECDDCMATPRPWARGRSAMLYRDKGRALVLALKHGDRPEVARLAAPWLARAARPLLRPDLLVAPVPLHRFKLLRRRYNQSALLTRALAEQTGLEHCPDLLLRRRATASQDGRSAAERFANLDGAIAVHPGRKARLVGRPVLLVDDVMTSGATLAACAEACRQAQSGEVFVLALARVTKDH